MIDKHLCYSEITEQVLLEYTVPSDTLSSGKLKQFIFNNSKIDNIPIGQGIQVETPTFVERELIRRSKSAPARLRGK